MRIELQEPYKSLYKRGYLRQSKKDGRRRLDLFNSEKDRTTVSYARYLMAVSLGRLLMDEEEVDHIDGDKANDSLDNLQVLDEKDHRKKTDAEREVPPVKVACTYCGKVFYRPLRDIRYSRKIGSLPYCSYSCNGKANGNGGASKLTREDVAEIRTSPETAKVLAKRFKVTKNSIYNIWKGRTWKIEERPKPS